MPTRTSLRLSLLAGLMAPLCAFALGVGPLTVRSALNENFEADIPLAYLDVKLSTDRSACRVHQLYHCVIIRGEARVVPDGPLKVAALNALAAKHEPDLDFTPVTEEMHPYKICKVVQIKPVSVSAKSDLFQNKTHEERSALATYLKGRNRPADEETIRAMGFDPAEV